MNAYYLHKPDGTQTNVSICGECGKLARGKSNFYISVKCCTCFDCGHPLGEDERRFENRRLYHRKCENKRRTERDAERLEKAGLLEDYDGPVYADGYGHGSYGDGYFADVAEFIDHFESRYSVDESADWPEFVYCCTATPVAGLDLDSILASHCEDAFEDAFEDARDSLTGVEELQIAVNTFNARNANVLSYSPDYSRKVAVKP